MHNQMMHAQQLDRQSQYPTGTPAHSQKIHAASNTRPNDACTTACKACQCPTGTPAHSQTMRQQHTHMVHANRSCRGTGSDARGSRSSNVITQNAARHHALLRVALLSCSTHILASITARWEGVWLVQWMVRMMPAHAHGVHTEEPYACKPRKHSTSQGCLSAATLAVHTLKPSPNRRPASRRRSGNRGCCCCCC